MPVDLQSPQFRDIEYAFNNVAQTAAQVSAIIDTDVPSTNAIRLVAARTATADGTGTGQIAAGTDFVTVTSADANNIITLPAPVVGAEITLQNGATGYELRSSTPASIGINGGVGSAVESAIAANITTRCTCTTATNWVCNSRTAAGVVGVTEVAA